MAFVEDVLKQNSGPAIGLGLIAMALPVVFPSLRPALANAVKAGAQLYFEAEGGAEADIIAIIAESAADQLADAVARARPEERNQAVAGILNSYHAKARARSDLLGINDRDRKARYRRHMHRLRRTVSRRQANASPERKKRWEMVASQLEAGRSQS